MDTLSLLALLPLIDRFLLFTVSISPHRRNPTPCAGPAQFPELFALYQDIGRRLELKTLPKLYLLASSNGVVKRLRAGMPTARQRYIIDPC